MYNDKSRLAELYGFWQTKPFKLTLTKDGHIPKNAFGNLETFNGPLPPECCYVNSTRCMPLAKKLGIEYVPAVVGFELGGRGSYPLVRGCVIFRKDEFELRSESRKWEEEAAKREEKKEKEAAKNAWK